MSHQFENAGAGPHSAFSAASATPPDRDHLHARELLGALFSSSQFSRREVTIDPPLPTQPEVRGGGYF